LQAAYPSAAITLKKDAGVTGNFEITVDGQLVHSKKTKGMGYCTEGSKERSDLLAAVGAIAAK
jgi:selT/selW/selH-like putative selenoprotein